MRTQAGASAAGRNSAFRGALCERAGPGYLLPSTSASSLCSPIFPPLLLAVAAPLSCSARGSAGNGSGCCHWQSLARRWVHWHCQCGNLNLKALLVKNLNAASGRSSRCHWQTRTMMQPASGPPAGPGPGPAGRHWQPRARAASGPGGAAGGYSELASEFRIRRLRVRACQ